MGFASRPHDLCSVTSSPASAKLRGGGNRSHPLLPDPKSSPCPKPFWTHFGQLNANPAAAAQFQDSAAQFSEFCPLAWLFLSLLQPSRDQGGLSQSQSPVSLCQTRLISACNLIN